MFRVAAMTNKVSKDQMEALLDFLTEHPTIAKGVGLGARSKVTIDKQWNDLAKKLNSFGNGSTKSGERWKKVSFPNLLLFCIPNHGSARYTFLL